MSFGDAPGKAILFGEHSVVYDRPAIAVPVRQIRASAKIEDIRGAAPGQVRIVAPQTGVDSWLETCDPGHPLARIVLLTLEELRTKDFPSIKIHITSSIPIAAGLGSGAAVSVAITRAICAHFHAELPLERQSVLAFEVEKLHHGTPSGIDNAVVTYDQPVYFVKGREPEPFHIANPFLLLIGDTGVESPTAEAVSLVRRRWQEDPHRLEALFDAIGDTARSGRAAIESGQTFDLGPLMNHNQSLLEAIGVSSAELNWLIQTARGAGALGAKLSGAGLGGNMIALVDHESVERVEIALRRGGARSVLLTEVAP